MYRQADWSKTYINKEKFNSISAYKKWFTNGGSKKKSFIRLDYIDMYKPPRRILIDGKMVNNPEYRRFYRGTDKGKTIIANWRADNKEHLREYDKQKYKIKKDYYIDRSKDWYRKERARLNTIKNMSWLEYFKQDRANLNKIKRDYGFDNVEQIVAMYEDGKCEICGMTNERHLKIYGNRLHIDHNHKTGAVRGLLCTHHNAMIGFAGDDTTLLEKGIAYIKKHEEAK